MGLFFLINSWAGKYPILDEAMRFFYVGAVPALGTALMALLFLVPPTPNVPSRRRVFGATLLALAFCGLTMLFVEAFSSALGSGTISPRPFMTRYVNVLVVEPQDNSFPCPEVMIAAMLATSIWALRPKFGLPAGATALLLAFARIFCGTNYFADVTVGLALGWAWMTLSLAACHVGLRLSTKQSTWHWRLGYQSAYAGASLLLVAGGTYTVLASDPRFASKLHAPWGGPATATELAAAPSGPTSAARAVMQEGEGMPASHDAHSDAEALALQKRSARFLPEVEKYLKGVLYSQAQPFRLLDVEVAPVKAGDTEYRCAALRFEIAGTEPDRRRTVAATAARLVKSAFHADSRLENVDVTAILRGSAKEIDGSDVVFVGDEVPVFTASIQRKNLLISPAWANLPNVDPGLWLRMRSRLYVNAKILPQEAAPPKPTPVAPVAPAITQNKSLAQGTPPRVNVTPPIRNVTPPNANVSPPVRNVTPPTRNVTPPTRNVTPPVRNVTPRTWNVTPPFRNVTPRTWNGTPPVKNVTPPTGNVTPRTWNGTPPHQNVTPPIGNVSPPTGNITPPGVNVTPPVPNVTPRTAPAQKNEALAQSIESAWRQAQKAKPAKQRRVRRLRKVRRTRTYRRWQRR